MKKIGLAMTSSFCSINQIVDQIISLMEAGYEIIPIASPAVVEKNTRFSMGKDIEKRVLELTKKRIITDMIEAEKFGPIEPLDLLLVAPATGNFIAKFTHAITDNTVCMVAKATLRNEKPIVLSIATNDGLGANGKNIMELLNRKNVFIVPFGQDDPINKPTSLLSDVNDIIPTIEMALGNKQKQPVIKQYIKNK